MRQRTRTALALLLALLCAACGTTVPLTTQVAAGGELGTPIEEGLGGPTVGTAGPDVATATPGDGSAPAAPGPGEPAPVAPGGVGATPASSGVDPGPAQGAAAPTGPREPVQVGIAYTVGQEEGAAAFGVEGERQGDQRVQAQSFVDWVNVNGGLNGHPIVPVWTPLELTDARSKAEVAAAICQQWTQDNHVVAGIFTGPNTLDLARCLNNAGVLYWQFGWSLHTSADHRQLPFMFNPGEIDAERLAQIYADALVDAGFFGPNPTVGILVNEYRAAQAALAVLRSRLQARGITVSDSNVYTIPQPSGWAQVTSALQALQNAQIKMRAGGVTHVLSLCWGCMAFFMQYAHAQGYSPEYGLTSNDLPLGMVSQETPATATQLPGTMGVGYWPITDVGVLNNPAAPVNDTWQLCQQIVGPTGEGSRTDADMGNAGAYCAAILFLRAAANASGITPITGDALRQGAERLGTSFQDPMSFHTTLGPGRHTGVDTVQLFRYVEGCTCFEYFGNRIPVP